MGRRFVFERPRTTSITVDALDAEIIRSFQYSGEPMYRTVTRIMREYAPPETVQRCKTRLEEAQKKVNARLSSGRQTNILANIDTVDEQDKHFAHSIQDVEFISKPDYLLALRKQFGVTEKSAQEEYDRRLKRGVILERHGLVEIVK